MLRVRIDNHEVKVMPISLAQMVFDGRLNRHDRAKPSDGATEQPLEYALAAPYLEALTAELLVRLQSMYRHSATAEEIDLLRTRVEALSRWHWDQPNIKARFQWSAAWLNELTERFEAAIDYYDAFLQTRCREVHLRLLAYNNRGVLCIRLGRLDGVYDLARAAIPSERSFAPPAPTKGLPAACFNLLNVIDVAAEVDNLTQTVDGALAEFFAELSEDARRRWLGTESNPRDADDDPLDESRRDSAHSGNGDGYSPVCAVLGDPTCRSLNRLLSNLADEALSLDGAPALDKTEAADEPCDLLLWGDSRMSGVQHEAREADGDAAPRPHDRYRDAAALLLSDQIPSSLAAKESPGRRAEQLAQEELAEIENLVAAGNFELARSRLQVQRKILSTLDHQGHCGDLLARVDAELLWIEHSEQELEQLHIQRACAKLVSELERFCTLTSLAPAEREFEDLKRELVNQKARLGSRGGQEFTGLLEELSFRAERHLARLRRLDARKRIRPSLRQLRSHWPTEWTAPVAEAAYTALSQCHLSDPSGRIEDWPRLREQLDTHQAHYRLGTALAELQNQGFSSTTETVMAEALALCPDVWRTIAPLFGLTGERGFDALPEAGAEMRTALEAAAAGLLNEAPSGAKDAVVCRQSNLLKRAASLLDRSFQRLHDDPKRYALLWNGVRDTLAPALADAPVAVVADIKAVAGKCLDHWPARKSGMPGKSDPRNPVRLFLESCEKTRCLASAEELLDAEPPKVKPAGEYIGWAIGMGLDSADQVRRAATCVYLAGPCAQDPPATQRRVLDSIDAWAEGLSEQAARKINEQEIVRRIEAIKAHLLSGPLESTAEQTAPSGSNEDDPDA